MMEKTFMYEMTAHFLRIKCMEMFKFEINLLYLHHKLIYLVERKSGLC